MVGDGFLLAGLSVGGFYLIYRKLPQAVRVWMNKHSLATDLTACVLTYMLFGGTLVALFAAAWAGILVSIMLAIVNNKTAMKLLAQIGAKLEVVKDNAVKAIEKYVESQEAKKPQLTVVA